MEMEIYCGAFVESTAVTGEIKWVRYSEAEKKKKWEKTAKRMKRIITLLSPYSAHVMYGVYSFILSVFFCLLLTKQKIHANAGVVNIASILIYVFHIHWIICCHFCVLSLVADHSFFVVQVSAISLLAFRMNQITILFYLYLFFSYYFHTFQCNAIHSFIGAINHTSTFLQLFCGIGVLSVLQLFATGNGGNSHQLA